MSKFPMSKSALLLSSLILAASTSPVLAEEATDNQAVTNLTTTKSNQTNPESLTSSTAETITNAAAPIPEKATSTSEARDIAPIEGQKVDLRILGTTDLHTNLVNYDYYQDKASENIGLAKTAVLIEEAKQENSNVLLVDNGDTIQGTPLGTYEAIVKPVQAGETHPMYEALHALGFEVGTLGNHEFNYGLDFLRRIIDSAKMPLVNANVRDPKTGDFIYTPYVVIPKTLKDSEGRFVTIKIGVTGIVPPQILNWDKANLEGKIVVKDSVEAVAEVLPLMRNAGADVTLVLSHSGIGDDQYEKGEENEGYQIASLPGVDAVVTGHSHAEFPSGTGLGFYEKYADVDGIKGHINGTPVTMAGKYGDHLGIIDLNLTYKEGKWIVSDSRASIRKVDTKSTKADERVLAIAQKAHQGTIQYVRQQVGTATAPINSYFALVKDDPSVQIVNNAQIWYAKQELAGTPEANLPILSAAAPFKAGTRGDATAYTDIPAGPIAIKNVADLYLYDNVTAILKVTGDQLKEWLEMSAGQFKQINPQSNEVQDIIDPNFRTYNFDVIDGITYQYDITQPSKYDRNGKTINESAHRVKNLQYKGQAVTADQEFIVVTNNYRANGNFPGVREASLNRLLNLENRQAIINYILAEKTINPSADQNWTFTDSIKGLHLRFLTADKAKNLVGQDLSLVYIGPSSSEGFGEFKYVYVESKKEEETTNQIGQTLPNTLIHYQPKISQKIIHLANSQQIILLPAAEQTEVTSQTRLPKTGEAGTELSLLGLLLASISSFSLLKRKKSAAK